MQWSVMTEKLMYKIRILSLLTKRKKFAFLLEGFHYTSLSRRMRGRQEHREKAREKETGSTIERRPFAIVTISQWCFVIFITVLTKRHLFIVVDLASFGRGWDEYKHS